VERDSPWPAAQENHLVALAIIGFCVVILLNEYLQKARSMEKPVIVEK
jgi:hypothetical protein